MATAQKWNTSRTPSIYWREAKTSPTGKLWKVYYPAKDEQGKPKQATKTFVREREAREFLEEKSHQKSTGALTDPKVGRRSLSELYEKVHQARRYAPATVELHRTLWKVLSPLHDIPIADVDRETVVSVLSKVKAPAMRQKARGLLSMLYQYAITEWGWKTNPATAPRRKKTRAERLEEGSNGKNGKRYLTKGELVALLSELPDRYRVLVALMSSMGLRPGEAYALRVGKFDPEARTLKIDTSTSGFTKTGEMRTLVLPVVIADLLGDHIERFSDPKDPTALIFPTEEGAMIRKNNFRNRVFAPARDRAKIDGSLTPNSCRHTAASFAIGAGANVYDVQNMMGHAKPSITLDVYGDLWEGSAERLAARQDQALRGAWGPALRVMGSVTAELPPQAHERAGEPRSESGRGLGHSNWPGLVRHRAPFPRHSSSCLT